MSDALREIFLHNAWANLELIRYCHALKPEQMAARAPGSFGTIAETVHHLIAGEAFYAIVLAKHDFDWPGFDEMVPTPERWQGYAEDLAAFWDEYLRAPFDSERLIIEHEDDATVEIRAGVLIAQAVYHGHVHREQVCAIITSLGGQPPDLEGWAYGTATGRHVIRPRTP